ncbi:MAG: OmpH family outer membrane protein, partial [Muribaculaceae bacterium]|nr:OmpH family outer membrane protein [Muribaculaceae bacterium]
KVQSNGYLSEASYNADMTALNQKQQQAQNYLGSLQAKAQQEALRQQQVFLDSLNNFLNAYNATHHYDAILIYSPGEVFNQALDITDEVIAGLNARYKKAADKSADKKTESAAKEKK